MVVGIAIVTFTGFVLMLVVLKFGRSSKFGIKGKYMLGFSSLPGLHYNMVVPSGSSEIAPNGFNRKDVMGICSVSCFLCFTNCLTFLLVYRLSVCFFFTDLKERWISKLSRNELKLFILITVDK